MNAKIEIAYRLPGLPWKRRTFANEGALSRWLDQQPTDIEVMHQEAA